MGASKVLIAASGFVVLFASLARAVDSKTGPNKPEPGTILDKKNPGHSVPLDAAEATEAEGDERAITDLAKSQAALKAGKLSKQDYDKSLAETEKKVEEGAVKFPASAPVQTSAARAFIQAGDSQKAVEHASQAMALAPADPFPVTTRSLAFFKAQDYPKAAQDAKKALELDPNDAAAKALYLLSKDRPAGGTLLGGAAPRVRHVLEEVSLPQAPFFAPPERQKDDDPELARFKTAAGRAYVRKILAAEGALKRKDYLTAYGQANAALAVYADNPRVLAARAVAAYSLQDYKTAVSDASLVLHAHPDMAAMLTVRAAAYNETSRHAEALGDAQKAIALASSQPRAYLERAIAHENLGDAPASALDDYKRAAELDPSFTADYLSALSRLGPAKADSAATAAAESASAASAAGSSGPTAALLARARRLDLMRLGFGALALFVLAAGSLLLARRAMP